jgi:hypothetical protein
MNPTAKSKDQYRLAGKLTVADYDRFKQEKNRDEISRLISDRFIKRYLVPLNSVPTVKKSGFCMMAIGCLMLEALESFYQGWPNTRGKSKAAFHSFIGRQGEFTLLRGQEPEFFEHVRCGILHQAETTGGWRIRRDKDGALFDAPTKTVNANAFIDALTAALRDYCETLKHSDWEDELWANARKKLDAICENCAH